MRSPKVPHGDDCAHLTSVGELIPLDLNWESTRGPCSEGRQLLSHHGKRRNKKQSEEVGRLPCVFMPIDILSSSAPALRMRSQDGMF